MTVEYVINVVVYIIRRQPEQLVQLCLLSPLYWLSCILLDYDENAKEPFVQVSGNPILPMGYRENSNLPTFTGL